MKVCERCGKIFQPSQSAEQIYCGPNCSRRAQRRRQKDRDQLAKLLSGEVCPRPLKIAYSSWEQAGMNQWALDHGLHAYRCDCGAIHYGHQKQLLQEVGGVS